jgi:hypothetical protein
MGQPLVFLVLLCIGNEIIGKTSFEDVSADFAKNKYLKMFISSANFFQFMSKIKGIDTDMTSPLRVRAVPGLAKYTFTQEEIFLQVVSYKYKKHGKNFS